jgi:hypothetical protein
VFACSFYVNESSRISARHHLRTQLMSRSCRLSPARNDTQSRRRPHVACISAENALMLLREYDARVSSHTNVLSRETHIRHLQKSTRLEIRPHSRGSARALPLKPHCYTYILLCDVARRNTPTLWLLYMDSPAVMFWKKNFLEKRGWKFEQFCLQKIEYLILNFQEAS